MLFELIIIEHQDPRQVPFWELFERQHPVPASASGSWAHDDAKGPTQVGLAGGSRSSWRGLLLLLLRWLSFILPCNIPALLECRIWDGDNRCHLKNKTVIFRKIHEPENTGQRVRLSRECWLIANKQNSEGRLWERAHSRKRKAKVCLLHLGTLRLLVWREWRELGRNSKRY